MLVMMGGPARARTRRRQPHRVYKPHARGPSLSGEGSLTCIFVAGTIMAPEGPAYVRQNGGLLAHLLRRPHSLELLRSVPAPFPLVHRLWL